MNSFEIIVNAVDSGTPIPETATTTVYVNVKDINDERPKFEQNSYAAYVSERTAVGESVLRVKAIDKDLNSKLEYGLVGPVTATTKAGVNIANRSNYRLQEAFRVDSQTGERNDIGMFGFLVNWRSGCACLLPALSRVYIYFFVVVLQLSVYHRPAPNYSPTIHPTPCKLEKSFSQKQFPDRLLVYVFFCMLLGFICFLSFLHDCFARISKVISCCPPAGIFSAARVKYL